VAGSRPRRPDCTREKDFLCRLIPSKERAKPVRLATFAAWPAASRPVDYVPSRRTRKISNHRNAARLANSFGLDQLKAEHKTSRHRRQLQSPLADSRRPTLQPTSQAPVQGRPLRSMRRCDPTGQGEADADAAPRRNFKTTVSWRQKNRACAGRRDHRTGLAPVISLGRKPRIDRSAFSGVLALSRNTSSAQRRAKNREQAPAARGAFLEGGNSVALSSRIDG